MKAADTSTINHIQCYLLTATSWVSALEVAAACTVMKLAGGYAVQGQTRVGMFAQRLLDGLSFERMNDEWY